MAQILLQHKLNQARLERGWNEGNSVAIYIRKVSFSLILAPPSPQNRRFHFACGTLVTVHAVDFNGIRVLKGVGGVAERVVSTL